MIREVRSMSKSLRLIALMLFLAACARESVTPVSQQTDSAAAGVQADQNYPGARYLAGYTGLFNQAIKATEPPPSPSAGAALYDTPDPIEQVAAFYAEKRGYGKVAESAANNFSSAPASAYFTRGDFASDYVALKPLLDKIHVTPDPAKLKGPYRGADIKGKPAPAELPGVTLQRPYFDFSKNQFVDRTLIVLIRE
jgi:hypothetical protein